MNRKYPVGDKFNFAESATHGADEVGKSVSLDDKATEMAACALGAFERRTSKMSVSSFMVEVEFPDGQKGMVFAAVGILSRDLLLEVVRASLDANLANTEDDRKPTENGN